MDQSPKPFTLVSPKDFGAIGDGTTDDIAAVLAAIATGKSIDFSNGTYAVSASVLPASNTTWVGYNTGGLKWLTKLCLIDAVSIANWRMEGVIVDGNYTAYTVNSALDTPWGVRVNDCDNIQIVGNVFKKLYRIGIMVGHGVSTPSTAVVVEANVVEDIGRSVDPSVGFGNGIASEMGMGVRIINNTVRRITGNTTATAGINVEPGTGQLCQDYEIAGNRIDDIDDAAGIQNYMTASLTASRDGISIHDNYIRNTGSGKGIFCRQFGDTSIRNNRCEDTQGISVSAFLDGDVMVTGNEVLGTTSGNGIELINGAKKAIITGNRIRNIVGIGIYTDVNDATAASLKSLTIANNEVMDVSSFGISFTGFQFSISNNLLTRCSTANAAGYYLQPNGSAQAIDGIVEGNVFTHFSGSITAFVRAEGDVFDQTFFGVNAFAGSPSRYLTTAIAGRIPGVFTSATPPGGTWKVSDYVYNENPIAGGTVQWVCTTAGTPGTWTAVGAGPFRDDYFNIIGSGDPTKKLVFEVDAQTTGKTVTISTGAQILDRTITVPVLGGAANMVMREAGLTDNAVVRADGANGLIQNTAVIIDDSNNITGVASLASGAITSTAKISSSKASAVAPITDANSALKLYDPGLGAGLFGQQNSGTPYAFQLQVADATMASQFPLSLNPLGGVVNVGAGGLTLGSTTLLTTSVALTDGAAAAGGTLLNAPTAGNPTKWIPINDNGTTRYIPCW